MSDEKSPLFTAVLQSMRIAEQTTPHGPRKRDLVLGMLITTGLVKENERQHIGVIIDLIVYCAQNAQDLRAFAKSTGCLPCLR